MTANRKLAAILAADVIAFSTMMQADEAGTLAVLKQRRKEVLEPLVAKHRGRVVKLMGDGVLIEFASAVAAVQCAVELQQAMAAANAANDPNGNNDKNVLLRIGVNLGDVLVEGSDLYGDGVNVAARLQALAEPGTICISGKVREEVQGKLELSMEDRGDVALKNMPRPVRVFQISPSHVPNVAPPLPTKPSIAVLPFVNMSGDREQDYFSDGISEEIITALSRMRSPIVIARNSSFQYKGRAVDVKQIGRELGVRYVLEGSVRKAANRLRITGQLIDAESGTHLWADRFDGEMEDIFDLQDQVTARVVGAIAPKLEEAEIERVRRKPTASLDAYDYFLRGMAGLHKWSREGNEEALSHFYRAIELDPNFATAHGLAARAYVQRNAGGWIADRPREVGEASRLARRAVELGHDDAVALCTAGFAMGDLVGEAQDGDAFIEEALTINPNLAWAWLYSGWVKAASGNPDLALERIARARRLSPHDPQNFSIHTAMAFAQFIAARYNEGLASAQAALRDRPVYQLANCMLAANAAMAGHSAEADKAIHQVLKLNPNLRLGDAPNIQFIRRPEDLARWIDALRKAGLPE
jgi:TolB-like protein